MTTHENEDGPAEAVVAAAGADRGEVEAAHRREVLRKAGAWAAAAPIMLALFDPSRASADCVGDGEPDCEFSF